MINYILRPLRRINFNCFVEQIGIYREESYFRYMIKQINIVMKSLIPEINIEIYNAFDKLLKDGKDGVQFEIIAMRGENRIPLLYESAGIKKLISICSNLVACYNRESYCLVVDELDSGIYEYLLGECLEVMQDKAKGQLIFTSHNLRPLEILENDSLLYTTVNSENCYIISKIRKIPGYLIYGRSSLAGKKKSSTMKQIYMRWSLL